MMVLYVEIKRAFAAIKSIREQRRLIGLSSIRDRLIQFKQTLFYIPKRKWRRKVMYEIHDAPYLRHRGVKTTTKDVAQSYYQPLKEDVEQYVKSCLVCQRNKHSTEAKIGLLKPLSISFLLYRDISLDFITSLPKYSEANSILVIVDWFSKMTRFTTMEMFVKDSKEESKIAPQLIVNLFFDT